MKIYLPFSNVIRLYCIGICSLFFSSEIVYSQSYINLSTPETFSFSKTYIARDSIKFSPGYSFSGSFQKVIVAGKTCIIKIGKRMSASIDDRIVDSADYQVSTELPYPNRSLDTSLPVGSTSGQADVRPSGSASYQIPIRIPAGINGIQPEISICYNSQSGNALLGYGWNLVGISLINRTGKNYYNDSCSEAPLLTNSDNIMLNGQRLLLISGTNLTDGAKYRTEIESYSDITCKTNNGNISFIVRTKDGLIMEYGSTTDSYIEDNENIDGLYWLLAKVTDRMGNYITYTYDENNKTGEYSLKYIDYTGNSTTGTAPSNRIEFFYKKRNDIQTSYLAGKPVTSSLLLYKIKTYISSKSVHEYQFDYYYDGFYSKLTEVKEYGDNGKHYNSTIINWGDYDGEYSRYQREYIGSIAQTRGTTVRSISRKPHSSDDLDYYQIFADFNGDGKTDFLDIPKSASIGDTATFYIAYTDSSGSVGFTKGNKIAIGDNFYGFLVADLYGDGKNEVIARNYHNNNYFFAIYKYDNTNPLTQFADGKNYEALVGDFNGDGSSEILIKNDLHAYDRGAKIVSYQGIDDWGTKYSITYANNCYLTDFNGNGKTDILVMNDTSYWVYELADSRNFRRLPYFRGTELNNKFYVYPGDFNGDGKTDILAQQISDLSKTFLLISNGTSFVKKEITIPGLTGKVFVANCNQDGKSEICFLKKNNNSQGNLMDPQIGVFNGNDFTITSNTTSIIDSTRIINDFSDYSETNVSLSDFDGDGRAEFFALPYDKTIWLSSFNDKQNLLVKGITDGLNNRTTFKYAPVADNAIYSESATTCTFPVVKSRIPLYVVSKKNIYSGDQNDSILYHYQDLWLHQQGKGFLCFGQIASTDYMTGKKFVSNYGYDSTYFNPYLSSQALSTTSGIAISTDIFTNSFIYEGPKRIFPYVSCQTQTNNLTGVTLTSAYSNLDYGTPRSIVKTYGNDLTETTTLMLTDVATTDKWILGLPQTAQTIQMRSGQSWTNKTVYEYDSNYQVNKKKIYTKDGTLQTDEETYTWDSFGNMLSKSTRPYNSTNGLTTTNTYTDDGRFQKSNTDPLGRTIYQTVNDKGQLATKTDVLGNVTRYEYDAMGLQTKTYNPDGTNAFSSLTWTSEPSGALYMTTKTSTNQPTAKIYYDAQSREIRSSQTCFDGTELNIDKQYDTHGQLSKESLPFKGSTAVNWNEYTYDTYGRPTQLAYASGKTDSWSYSQNSTTETKNGISATKNHDATGSVTSVNDPGGTIMYNLRSDGQPSSVVAPGGITTSFGYDDYGRQDSIFDPSGGAKGNRYDASGNLSRETDANGKTTTMVYDAFNRLTIKAFPEYTITYSYNTDGSLNTVSSTNGTSKTYTYDLLGRVSTEKENIPESKWLQKQYTYSSGKLSAVSYVSQSGNLATENYVYANGCLSEVKLNNQTTLWRLDAENDLGQPSQSTTGPLTRAYTYDNYGLPTARSASSTSSGTFFNQSYSLNPATGNLNSRKDETRGILETFTYDNLNRLTTYGGNTAQYDAKGNIKDKSDVGNFSYNTIGKPYAISRDSIYSNATPLRDQHVTYTSFMRPDTIQENGNLSRFTYNSDGDRVRMRITRSDTLSLDRFYVGDGYEMDVNNSGTTERLYLGGDTYSAPAVYIKNASTGSWDVYYICRDYLGSITAITNSSGSLVQELSYDAWGRLRNPETLVAYTSGNEPALLLGRGYTGHEHLAMFGLINMNARLYDPALGRFLSPDPNVQAPGFSQNFNRYSYGLNNPLMYNDETGEFWNLIIGGAIGGVVNWATHGAEFSWKGLGYFGVGALAGALGAGIGGGVSSAMARGGSFWAGFMGTSAAKIATGSFISGAAIGGSAGFSAGFTTGLGNGLLGGQTFGKALGSGVGEGLIGGFSGGLIGGITGGIDAVLNHRNFFDGSTFTDQTLTPPQNVPTIGERGKYNCMPANGECVDKSFGGNMTQEDLRKLAGGGDPDLNGVDDLTGWDKYSKISGHEFVGENADNMSYSRIIRAMSYGDRVSINLNNIGSDVGHSVVMQSVVLRTITKVSGNTIPKYLFYVMNPGHGGSIMQISAHSIANAAHVFYIFP